VVQLALAAIFVACGGLTKGIVGLGLPLVAVPLLSSIMPVPEAVSLMIVPILVTNLYQMLRNSEIKQALTRFWPAILFLVLGMPIGTFGLTVLKTSRLDLVLALVVIAFVISNLFPRPFTISPRHERWWGPPVGLVSGVIGGLSSQYGPPIGLYLLALKVPKDTFIATMAVTLEIGGVVLFISLLSFHVLQAQGLMYSSLAVVPAFIGLVIGEHARSRFSQETFQKAVLLTLLVTAAFLIRRGLHG
jgi:uncharacterized membrane protein YfcA